MSTDYDFRRFCYRRRIAYFILYNVFRLNRSVYDWRIAFEVPRWLSVRLCHCCRVYRNRRYRLDLWPPTWPRHRRAAACPAAVSCRDRRARAPTPSHAGQYYCRVSVAAANVECISAAADVPGYDSDPAMWLAVLRIIHFLKHTVFTYISGDISIIVPSRQQFTYYHYNITIFVCKQWLE